MWAWLLANLPGLASKVFAGLNFASMIPPLVAVLKHIQKYWRFYLPAFLLVLQGGTLYEWNQTKAELTSERVSHAQDIEKFKEAQQEADAKAQAQKEQMQKEAQVNADKADVKYSALLNKYRANLVLYQRQANQGRANASGNSQDVSTPEGGDGPGTGSNLLSDTASGFYITEADAEVCAVNTARLQAVHDWATDPENYK